MLKTTPSHPATTSSPTSTPTSSRWPTARWRPRSGLRKTYDPACNNKAGCYPAATGGAVVVMSPQTGAVYAMSSFPSYDPSVWVGGISQADYSALTDPANNEPLLNRAIDGLYTPGSTFKLNTATAALQTGLITPGHTYYDSGTFKTPGCQYNSTTCVFHNSSADETGTYNVSARAHGVQRRLLLQPGVPVLRRVAKYGATADPGPGRPVQPG